MANTVGVDSWAGLVATLVQFRKDRSGAIAVLFALVLAPLLLVIGMSIDYGHASTYQTSVQRVLDEAVIAGATTLAKTSNASKAELATQRRFNATKPKAYEVKLDVKVDSRSGTVTAGATGHVPTSFMTLAGYKHLKVTANAIASAKRAPRHQGHRLPIARHGKEAVMPRFSEAKVHDLIDRVERLCFQLRNSGFAERVPQCRAVFDGSFARKLLTRVASNGDTSDLLPVGVRLVK